MTRHIIILLTIATCILSAYPQSSRMSDLKKQQKEAQQRVANTSKKLKAAQLSAKKSLSRLNQITAEITLQKKEINKINTEINKLQRQERNLSQKINTLETTLKEKKREYALAIQSIYRQNSGYETLIFLFSANTFSQTIRRIRYLKEFSAWRRTQAEEIKAQQEELVKKRAELAQLRKERKAALDKLQEEAEKLKKKEADQKVVVNNMKKNEKALRSELKRQKEQAAALDRKIEQLIAEEARKSNQKSDTERKPQSYGGYSMTKDEQVLAKSFEQNKGKLPMPLSGRYMIIGHFGRQQHSELKYVQVNNSGIIIKTLPGTEARSVFDGVVTKIFVVPGYNSSVIVRHGNYLTIYSNLSEVYVKVGSKVKTRQAIGRIYSDPEDNNSTLLHFQLWKETAKQNPELWLDK